MEARPLDKWILVTGSNDGGLGEATSVAFLARGFNVIAASFDDEPLSFAKPLKGSTDGFLVRFGLDTTSARSIEAAVQHVQQLTDGKLDFLINLAGCGYYMPLIDAHIKDARNQFDVNVWGTLAVTQAFFPMLRAAKGIIINHVTIAGVSGLTDPFTGIYASSQAALRSLSDTMRLELAPFEIKVITLITGPAKAKPARRTTEDMRFGLSESSPYRYIEDDAVESMLSLISAESDHQWFQVAEDMVRDLHKEPTPAYIINGYITLLLWWIGWLLPAWLTDWVTLQRSGLLRLKGPARMASSENLRGSGRIENKKMI